jgi:hypothetical protein
LFALRQNYNESLREYLARFCESTSKVSNPNQEMFVSAFHHGLKAGHFNESLAQKPATSMQEVTRRAEGYIKGEESNAEKRMRAARERGPINKNNGQSEFYHHHRLPIPNHHGMYRHRKPYQPQRHFQEERKEYTPLNRARVYIMEEILQAGLGRLPPPRNKEHTMGLNPDAWCAYHRCRGHDTEKCFRLRDLIEELIKSGHLRKFIEDAAAGKVVVLKVQHNQAKDRSEGEETAKGKRISVNTIA